MGRSVFPGNFLRWFARFSSRTSRSHGSDLGPVAGDEELARFIFSKNNLRASQGKARYTAFLPAPDGKSSVFRTNSLGENAVWDLAEEQSSKRRESLKAFAAFVARWALDLGLHVEADPISHPRHANLSCWPNEEEKQRMVALELAEKSSLRVYPSARKK